MYICINTFHPCDMGFSWVLEISLSVSKSLYVQTRSSSFGLLDLMALLDPIFLQAIKSKARLPCKFPFIGSKTRSNRIIIGINVLQQISRASVINLR